MRKRNDDSDLLDDHESEPVSGYRSLGEWGADGDDRDEIAAFDDDDDPSRRRDPLRKS